VTRPLVGLPATNGEITIQTGRGGGDCGYDFQVGKEYIVFAYDSGNENLGTGICSPTRPIEQATEDLRYFDQLPTAKPLGEIRVTTFDPSQSWMKPSSRISDLAILPETQIHLKGEGTNLSAKTDSDGRAFFRDLPPGKYTITASRPNYLMAAALSPIELHAKGCAEVATALRLNRTVKGLVTNSEGLPAPNIRIEAIDVNPVEQGQPLQSRDNDTTNSEGRFELPHLRTGKYYIGVSLTRTPTPEAPYTRWFYPGTEEESLAEAIEITDQPQTYTLNFKLPPAQQPRLIEGIVLDGTGNALRGIYVYLEDPRWPGRFGNLSALTNESGMFSIRALDGTAYRIRARMRDKESTPILIEPSPERRQVSLTITK
jgi:protocatechuate 3,4-dioxygenase beta subunit